jgi:hypothetical protein
MMLLPALVVGGDHAPVSAIPHIQYLGEEYEMKLGSVPSQLCIGEKKTITAWVKQYGVYKNLSTSARVRARRPRPYRVDRGVGDLGLARTNVEIDNPSVLVLTDEVIILDTVLWIRATVQGKKAGTATVNLTAARPGVVGTGQSIIVRVTECDYQVHVGSIWHLNAGRNIVAGSSIDTIITGANHAAGSIYNEHATAENVAVSFEPPCQAVYDLPSSDAGVFARLRDDTLDVDVAYGPTDVTTGVTCLVVSGGHSDAASRDEIHVQIPAGGGSASTAHVLHAPGIGDFTGMSYITLTPIPR